MFRAKTENIFGFVGIVERPVACEKRFWVDDVAWCQGEPVGEAMQAVADVAASWLWVWVFPLRFGVDVSERDILEVVVVLID